MAESTGGGGNEGVSLQSQAAARVETSQLSAVLVHNSNHDCSLKYQVGRQQDATLEPQRYRCGGVRVRLQVGSDDRS
jgi:hypothetical protein